ncbi:MAG: hypothetical protein CME64_08185 [Halobacteriovoraceae bacterium]|nr:hypothetical protein [Halobacteriovoraceae bacterium]|tara:strand:+ start:184458 stop:185291 length:834 start_codon:yes stop_codon:yes gene_type:complete
MSKEFDVVTIVKGRRKQLYNQFASIEHSSIKPSNHVVVRMNDDLPIDFPSDYKGQLVDIKTIEPLPLAKARNKGLEYSKSKTVIFLDVDCLVEEDLFEKLLDLKGSKNVITAYPKYLKEVPHKFDLSSVRNAAIEHPRQKRIQHGVSVDWKRFWSLVFCVEKKQMSDVGGFDENFQGYGAEDTDLAEALAQAGNKLIFANSCIYHQYHTKYDPPLQHIHSILKNANYFKEKWNYFPMTKWLDAFIEQGFVIFHQNEYVLRAYPSQSEIEAVLSETPY